MTSPHTEASSTLDELIQLVNDDPSRGITIAGGVATRAVEAGDHAMAAGALRAQALAHDYVLDLTAAVVACERAVEQAQLSGDLQVLGEVEMTRAGVLAHAGRSTEADGAIDSAVSLLSGVGRARAMVQRGILRYAVGDLDESLSDFAAAQPMLTRAGDDLWLAHLAVNRGVVLGFTGEYRRAQTSLDTARGLYTKLAHRNTVAEVTQNMGWLAAVSGDITAAFTYFDQAETQYRAIDAGLGPLWIDRCQALMACHLAAEARLLARRAVAALSDGGYGIGQGEALVALAEAALLDDEPEEALEAAEAAEALFHAQDRRPWAAYASYLSLRARFDQGRLGPSDLTEARRLAAALGEAGLRDYSLHTRLLCGRAALRLGDVAGGEADLDLAARARRSGSVTLRVQAWLAIAVLRLAKDNRSGAAAAIRAGIGVVDGYGAALGALEARTRVSAHAVALADIGMRLALESGRPRRIFEWMERSRARALDFLSVRPPEDDTVARILTQLRHTERQLHTAELEGEPHHRLRVASHRLQEQVRRLTLRTAGSSPLSKPAPGVDRLIGALDGRCLVELGVTDDALHAVVVHGGRFRHHRIGRLGAALDALETLRFGLDRLARTGGSERSRASARLLVAEAMDALDRATLPHLPGERVSGVVVVPPPELFAVPWATLPSLAGRLVTVSPSARLWLNRIDPPRHRRRGVVIASGPDLPGAAREGREVGSLYSNVARFTARTSKVDEVLAALDGARIAHIVAHGSFRADNPLFSALRLADGGLTVYDLERVERLPPVMVLSSCNSGIQAARPGNETMGIVAGLLGAGVRTVIASTGLVPDTSLTTRTMVRLHRRLVGGAAPAEALAAAQTDVMERGPGGMAAARFVCFGAG